MVASQIAKSADVFSQLLDHVRSEMPVAALTRYLRTYYQEQGLWEDRGWVGGYELGIAIPPDWDGPFTYDAEIDPANETLTPGMVINLESTIYLPEGAGRSMTINTMAFTQDDVRLLTCFPNGLQIVE